VWNDVRYGLRALFKNPTFAVAAVLILAFGIGANTAVFSIVRAVMLRPLPYHDPDRLVFIANAPRPGSHLHAMDASRIEAYKSSKSFDGIALLRLWSELGVQVDLLRPDGSERLIGSVVTPNFFELLGVRTALGRTFQGADVNEGPFVILSHALWRTRFGADPDIIGRSVRLAELHDSRAQPPFTIIGVLPEQYRLQSPKDSDIYLVRSWSELVKSGAIEVGMIARLRPNVAPAQVSAEFTAIEKDVIRARTNWPEKIRNDRLGQANVVAETLAEHMNGQVRSGMVLIAAVAGLFLLMACVNIGLLLLARTVGRTSELALRVSLGGSRSRILQQLMTEGITLAAVGGVVGVLAASMTLPLIRSLLPPNIPRVDEISLDASVLAFAFLATTMTGLVCGLAPSWIATRRDLLDTIRRSSMTASSDKKVSFVRNSVVGFQVAMVLVLVVSAGLLLQSFWRLQNVDVGFNAEGVITLEMRLLDPKFRQPESRAAFQQEVMSRVRAIPGVMQASMTTAVPMRGTDFSGNLGQRNGPAKSGNMRSVDPDYFDVMNIPLKAGRSFTAADTTESHRVMIVSESYGRAHFGAESPLGKLLVNNKVDIEIVGVVGDVRSEAVATEARPAFYFPRSQEPSELMCLVVMPRSGEVGDVAAALRAAVKAVDPDQPVQGITTIDQIVEASTADRRFYAVATGSFATVGLVLATVGLFGVVSRSVSERRREFAIRAAMGADPSHIVRLVLRLGLLPALLGALAGLGMAYLGSRLLRSFVFQVTTTDPWTYIAAALMIVVVAVGASLVPALGAMRVAPMAVLKSE